MWKRIALATLLLLLGVAAFVFWPESLRVDDPASARANYDVRILRDEWGVPHIFGQTDADVAYGLAYAHAEDDFLTIQQTLLAARGQLASVYGKDAAPNDYMVHLLRVWDVVDASYTTNHSPEVRALCEAYAAGLNRYAVLHPDQALPGLFPVTGQDMVAGSVHKSPLSFGLDTILAQLFEPERPQVLNPESGFVQNCNSSPFQTTIGPGNPRPNDFASSLGIETQMTNRALRALELFAADESITEDEFYTYKYDMAYSSRGDMPQYVQSILAAPLHDDPDVQTAVDVVQDWNLRADPESTGAGLVIWTLQSLDFPAPGELEPEALARAFEDTVRTFKEAHGHVDIPWSDVNRLRHGDVDLGLGGGPDLLPAVCGKIIEGGKLAGRQGDSFVMLAAWDREGTVHSRSIHQYGSATLDETSRHYADQAPLFAQRQLKPVWLDERRFAPISSANIGQVRTQDPNNAPDP